MSPRYNEKVIAAMNRERESVEFRSRTTRLAKWKELYAQAQLDLQVSAGVPDRIQLLGRIVIGFLL